MAKGFIQLSPLLHMRLWECVWRPACTPPKPGLVSTILYVTNY
jgi:hypothetical protein